MKIATESKTDFDYSVSTEDRFALRHWLEDFVAAINHNDRGMYEGLLNSDLVIEGFTEGLMDRTQYLDWLHEREQQKIVHVLRFPALKIKYKYRLFHLVGTYEEFISGILSFEGTVEMLIIKDEDNFKLSALKFFPRLRLTPNENS